MIINHNLKSIKRFIRTRLVASPLWFIYAKHLYDDFKSFYETINEIAFSKDIEVIAEIEFEVVGFYQSLLNESEMMVVIWLVSVNASRTLCDHCRSNIEIRQ